MKKIYTWMGEGYSLHECKLNNEIQEALLEGYTYIDNTSSDINPGCFYVLIENMRII